MTTNSLKNQLRHTMRRDLWLTVAPADLPDHDVVLLAPTANLVARDEATLESMDAVKQVSA